jgi:hypothetical protein
VDLPETVAVGLLSAEHGADNCKREDEQQTPRRQRPPTGRGAWDQRQSDRQLDERQGYADCSGKPFWQPEVSHRPSRASTVRELGCASRCKHRDEQKPRN